MPLPTLPFVWAALAAVGWYAMHDRSKLTKSGGKKTQKRYRNAHRSLTGNPHRAKGGGGRIGLPLKEWRRRKRRRDPRYF